MPRTCLRIVVAQVILLPLFSLDMLPGIGFAALLFLWAASSGGVSVPQQMIMATRYSERLPIMLAMNATGTYAGTAIGAALAGAAYTRSGLTHLGLVACALGVLAILTCLATLRPARG